MPVLQTKTEATCKVCNHAERLVIEGWLEERALRKITYENVVAKAAVLDPPFHNPRMDNFIIHFKKHMKLISDDEQREKQAKDTNLSKEVLEMCEKEFGAGWQSRMLRPDEYLTFVRICAQYDLLLRVQRGEKTGATIDHGLKSVAERTKRKQSESEDEMRDSIGQAMEKWAETQKAGA